MNTTKQPSDAPLSAAEKREYDELLNRMRLAQEDWQDNILDECRYCDGYCKFVWREVCVSEREALEELRTLLGGGHGYGEAHRQRIMQHYGCRPKRARYTATVIPLRTPQPPTPQPTRQQPVQQKPMGTELKDALEDF